VLLHHCHVVAPTTVDVKTDSSTFSFAGKFRVSVCSVELEACQLHNPHSHVSVKHKTADEEKSLFFSQQQL